MNRLLGVSVVGLLILSSCSPERSSSTGWEYNNSLNGGFEKVDEREQETGPGLVMVEGGTFTMGRTEQDVMHDWNARASRVTIASFYMDRTEVTNFHWLEYMYWMKRVYYKTYPHVYKKCLPDTLSWRTALGYREKYVNYYLRHPSYADYPVVGVSWLQANDFCKWRTDRVNEAILVREGVLKWHFASAIDASGNKDVGAAHLRNEENYNKKYISVPENMFSTENYLNGNYTKESTGGYTLNDTKTVKPDKNYEDKYGNQIPLKRAAPRDPYQLENYDPVYADDGRTGDRPVRMEDGMLLPNYRLPTEAEWEFAALGLIGNLDEGSENINDRRIYPWDGHYVRQEEEQFAGAIQANFIRGKGDLMGLSGNLNDGSDITARVDDYWPNDFGLYNMGGNVSEWVMDVYRPMSSEATEEFMPFRGNKFQTQLLVPDGLYDRPVKANENIYDVHGMKEFVNEFARVKYLAYANKNYKQGVGSNYQSNTAIKNVVEEADTLYNRAKRLETVSKISGSSKDSVDSILKIIQTEINNKNSTALTAKMDVFKKYLSSNSATVPEVKIIFDELTLLEKGPAPLVNNNPMNSRIYSKQDPRGYQFNSPSSYYISNNSQFTSQERKQFEFLDELNTILDTDIILYNQGRTIFASAYVERVLFNYSAPDITLQTGSTDKTTIAEIMQLAFNRDEPQTIIGAKEDTALFSKSSLEAKFSSYSIDPTITTWIMTLRNGLTEFITETKGNQRWRNVTVEENAGRLNYRKDDYIDYMDGDLESSIYYKSNQRKDDINNGIRDPKQVMYQNQHENMDLNGNSINAGVSGWPTTLISDKSRVYKGGSWADRVYWLSAGNRRFLDEDKATATIGFRCAMDRVGSSRPKSPKE
jgi:formylglycine-generating enzyme required for sulfatase activity